MNDISNITTQGLSLEQFLSLLPDIPAGYRFDRFEETEDYETVEYNPGWMLIRNSRVWRSSSDDCRVIGLKVYLYSPSAEKHVDTLGRAFEAGLTLDLVCIARPFTPTEILLGIVS